MKNLFSPGGDNAPSADVYADTSEVPPPAVAAVIPVAPEVSSSALPPEPADPTPTVLVQEQQAVSDAANAKAVGAELSLNAGQLAGLKNFFSPGGDNAPSVDVYADTPASEAVRAPSQSLPLVPVPVDTTPLTVEPNPELEKKQQGPEVVSAPPVSENEAAAENQSGEQKNQGRKNKESKKDADTYAPVGEFLKMFPDANPGKSEL